MIAVLLGALFLTAAPTDEMKPAAAETADDKNKRARLVLLDLQANGVDEATVKTLGDVIGTAFSRHRQFDVVSAGDLRAMMNVEAARQACDSGDSCMAEVAAALGADLVAHGSVGRLGELTVVNLSLFDAAKSSAVGREKVQSADVGALSMLLDGAVDRLAQGRNATTVVPTSSGVSVGLLVGGIAAAVVGVGAAGVGGVLASQSFATLEDPATNRAAKDDALGLYAPMLAVGITGAALAVAGVGMGVAAVVAEER